MKRLITWSYWIGWAGMALAVAMPLAFIALGRNTPGIVAFMWLIGILVSIISGVLLTKQSWWCPVFIITGFGSLIVALAMSVPAS